MDRQIDDKKRKAIDDREDIDKAQKRFKTGTRPEILSPSDAPSLANKSTLSEFEVLQNQNITSKPTVDESEWAAFQADIATTEGHDQYSDTVISAPALTAEEIKIKSAEEIYLYNREKEEAERTEDVADAARKIEEELEKMEILEAKVKRLRAKREELRRKERSIGLRKQVISKTTAISSFDSAIDAEVDDEDDNKSWDKFDLNW